MVPHSSILAWEIPWTEEPGGLQPMESKDTTEQLGMHVCACVTHTHTDVHTHTHTHTHTYSIPYSTAVSLLHFYPRGIDCLKSPKKKKDM